MPIIGLTDSETIANRMCVVWGVTPVVHATLDHMSDVTPVAIEKAKWVLQNQVTKSSLQQAFHSHKKDVQTYCILQKLTK